MFASCKIYIITVQNQFRRNSLKHCLIGADVVMAQVIPPLGIPASHVGVRVWVLVIPLVTQLPAHDASGRAVDKGMGLGQSRGTLSWSARLPAAA